MNHDRDALSKHPDSAEPPSAPPAPDHDDVERARRWHERSGEVELIISGALVFGLFQVPGVLDHAWSALEIRTAGALWAGAFLVWYYAKLIVYTLIGGFSFHLVTRAYWVGLIGLDSAFPSGVDWKRINYGELSKEEYRRLLPTLPRLIRIADNVASVVFSMAFWIILIFVLSIVLGTAVALIGFAVARLGIPGVTTMRVWFAVMLLVGGIPVTAVALDRIMDGKLHPERGMGPWVRRGIRMGYRSAAGGLFMPIQFTLFSNVDKRVIWPAYLAVFVLLIAAFFGGLIADSGLFVISPSELTPTRPGPRTVDARYYADREGGANPATAVPYIQSEIVEGPYVRLHLPIVARRHGDAVARACPDAPALSRTGVIRSALSDPPADEAAAEQALACWQDLWQARLDGVPTPLALNFASEPGLGVSGLVAYLPTAELAPGAHTLAVEDWAYDDDGWEEAVEEAGERGEAGVNVPRRVHYIRFWK